MDNYLLKLYNKFILWVCFVYPSGVSSFVLSFEKVSAEKFSSPQGSLHKSDSRWGYSEPRDAVLRWRKA